MPRVSILIPTYARPWFLAECIDAALDSTEPDIEVIVGDDGDLGAAVCAARTDPRLRYVKHPQRLGMAGNWNALMDLGTGDYLALCMDDDRLAPRFSEACLAVADQDRDLGVVFSNHTFDDGATTRTRERLLDAGRHDGFAALLVERSPVAVSAALVRRDAWAAVRPLPDTAAADMVLFGRLAEAGFSFAYVDEPLMTYRGHGDMLSSSVSFKTDCIAAWESLRFTDPSAEVARRWRLGDAYVSRARHLLLAGDGRAARSDLRRAREVGTTTSGASIAAAALLSRAPAVAPLAARAVRAVRAASK